MLEQLPRGLSLLLVSWLRPGGRRPVVGVVACSDETRRPQARQTCLLRKQNWCELKNIQVTKVTLD